MKAAGRYGSAVFGFVLKICHEQNFCGGIFSGAWGTQNDFASNLRDNSTRKHLQKTVSYF
jgi:hypothetical protein